MTKIPKINSIRKYVEKYGWDSPFGFRSAIKGNQSYMITPDGSTKLTIYGKETKQYVHYKGRWMKADR